MPRATLQHKPAARARLEKPVPVPALQYPPGHFLALVRKHDWPPRFEPSPWASARLSNGLTQSEQSTMYVELGRAAGRGYASGTIPLTGTPKMHKPLGWM